MSPRSFVSVALLLQLPRSVAELEADACRIDEWLFSEIEELVRAGNDTQWPKGQTAKMSLNMLRRLKGVDPLSLAEYSLEEKFRMRVVHWRTCDWLARHHHTRADLRERLLERAVDHLGLFHSRWQWTAVYHEELGAHGAPFFSSGTIQQRWPEMAEAIAALQAQVMPVLAKEYALAVDSEEEHPEGLHVKGSWTVLNIGGVDDTNDVEYFACDNALFPGSCMVLSAFDEALRRGRQGLIIGARFATLHPGTKVVTHTSSTNQRLKLHCGISNPSAVEIRIANVSLVWKEGECILIDDSFEHDIESSLSQKARTILELKIDHPDLSEYGWRLDDASGRKMDAMEFSAL